MLAAFLQDTLPPIPSPLQTEETGQRDRLKITKIVASSKHWQVITYIL